MNNIEKLQKNIFTHYVYSFIMNFGLTGGVWMLYLASKGLSLFQIGLMETIFHISSFTMEIPTGAIADIYGRKTSRVLGRISNIISILIIIFSQSVWMFAIAFFFSALSYNMESGAGDALIYDSLKEINMEDKYMKIRGNTEMCYQLANVGSLLVGGYIATFSYALAYKISLIIGIAVFFQSLTFTEPTIGKVKREKNFLKTFFSQIRASVMVIKNDYRIGFLIVLSEIFATFYTTEFFYLQNHFKLNGHSEFQIGIILSTGGILAAFMASQVHKLEKKYKIKKILLFLPIISTICFWGITISGYERYFFIILSIVEGMMFVVIGDYVNKLIPSEQRATILSFQSMCFSFFMIILFPAVGKIGDIYGLHKAFIVIALVATTALLVFIALLIKDKNKNEVRR